MMMNIWFWALAAFLLVDYVFFIVLLSRSEAVKEMSGGKKLQLYILPLVVAVAILAVLWVKGVFN